MRITILALVVGFMVIQADRGRAQSENVAPGTVFIQVTNQASVTVAKNGITLGAFAFPKGTLLSAVDEHRQVRPTGPGRFEFHGAFELRALTKSEAIPGPAVQMMRQAPVVLMAQGVDVLVENVQ
jgi:hypothetical protein